MQAQDEVLVCGGAGYIGAHMCRQLAAAGFRPVVFDDLSTGHRAAVRWGPLVEGSVLDPAALRALFAAHRFRAVLHFAAKALVAESMREPLAYFRTNTTGTLNLVEAMRDAGVDRLVFSSTCAVYGDPQRLPIDESHPTQPVNPYGWSKLQAERIIAESARAHGLRAIALRYFNVAGAADDGSTGEDHDPETHLLPNLVRAALDPGLGPVTLFGDDFATADGTCVRDYVHVEDLCEAHLAAMRALDGEAGLRIYNLGTGTGHSVAQVVAACRAHFAGKPATVQAGRRPGDPSELVASHAAATENLGWRPRRGIEQMVASAARWHARAR